MDGFIDFFKTQNNNVGNTNGFFVVNDRDRFDLSCHDLIHIRTFTNVMTTANNLFRGAAWGDIDNDGL